MAKLINSNCKAKKVACSTFLGMMFSVDVGFGWFRSKTYKPKHMVKVTLLKTGKDLSLVKEGILASFLGGWFAFGWILGRSMSHKKENGYEIEFLDGNIVAFYELDEAFQKKLDQLVLEKRGY